MVYRAGQIFLLNYGQDEESPQALVITKYYPETLESKAKVDFRYLDGSVDMRPNFYRSADILWIELYCTPMGEMSQLEKVICGILLDD